MVPPRSPLEAAFRTRCPSSIRSSGRSPAPRSDRTRSSSPPSIAAQIARRLDHRHLHAEADAEIRHVARSRANFAAWILPSVPRSPKPPGTRMPLTSSRNGAGVFVLEDLAFDPFEIDLDIVGDAAMRRAPRSATYRRPSCRIFADNGDGDLAFGIAHALVDEMPAREIRARRAFRCRKRRALRCRGRRRDRRPAPRRCCRRRAPGSRASRTLQNSAILRRSLSRDRPVGAAEKNVGLNADGAQLLHRMLRRLGLELAGARECRAPASDG